MTTHDFATRAKRPVSVLVVAVAVMCYVAGIASETLISTSYQIAAVLCWALCLILGAVLATYRRLGLRSTFVMLMIVGISFSATQGMDVLAQPFSWIVWGTVGIALTVSAAAFIANAEVQQQRPRSRL